ncbi:pentatricopeptide repeat-containing protein At4g04370 [Punica granatum]|uniref:Pentatricopeptide repeat-containing protein At4g04370 n=1 Tax=Punica granatum TaxID=22663 RepID=A0A218XEL3_PUNGR|nr:pentatricopeptide repeat-containing protein At4g04370 [Punica granatum]OWM83384.1 hypothetical protein CDL15_Pgr012865 [Punica granatum]
MSKLKPSIINGLNLATSPPSTATLNAAANRLSPQSTPLQLLLACPSTLRAHQNSPDPRAFPSLLKACASLALYPLGLSLHQHIVVGGFASDAYVASSLISFYAKFGSVDNAQKVFDRMPDRNVVPWSSIIGCYSRSGYVDNSFALLRGMRREGVAPTSVTLIEMLSGDLSELAQVKCLHCLAVLYGFQSDLILLNSLLNAYSKCRSVHCAEDLFELMGQKDIISWNTMISAYVLVGYVEKAVQLLYKMRVEGRQPDQQTFGSLVSATATISNLKLGQSLHGHILRLGLAFDVHLETSLITMYLKSGSSEIALRLFDIAQDRDVIQWTALISGLVQNDCAKKATDVFRLMLESGESPSSATLATLLAASAQLDSYNYGTSIHGYILRRNISVDLAVKNSLITMYAKCNGIEKSRAVFDQMENKDLVSWNAIIAGYAQNGHICQSFSLFNAMREVNKKPDSITVISLLQVCASTCGLQQGKWVHSYVIRGCLGPCVKVETALVDMYSKCGSMDYAQNCFDRMLEKDLISWAALIAGYGCHGKGEVALRVYSEFLRRGSLPNDILFLSVLSSCSHSGLVNQGLELYHSMTEDFGIEPRLEHSGCIVDLLCRARRVQEAYEFYRRAFLGPDFNVLGILLDACRANGLEELADVIAQEMYLLMPENAGSYVQLVHSYASMSRWDSVNEVWTKMRTLGLRKPPAWSFIELCGSITTFFAGHSSHPQFEEIKSVLRSLSWEMEKMDINLKLEKDS